MTSGRGSNDNGSYVDTQLAADWVDVIRAAREHHMCH